MAQITCNQCGQQVSDRAHSCPHCGAPVVVMGNMIETEIIRPLRRIDHHQSQKPLRDSEKSHTGMIVFAILLPTLVALLLLALIVGAMLYFIP